MKREDICDMLAKSNEFLRECVKEESVLGPEKAIAASCILHLSDAVAMLEGDAFAYASSFGFTVVDTQVAAETVRIALRELRTCGCPKLGYVASNLEYLARQL